MKPDGLPTHLPRRLTSDDPSYYPVGRAAARVQASMAREGVGRFPRRKDPAYLDWVRSTQHCRIPGQCTPGVQPHHYPAKGAGGAHGDDARVAPLCNHHHHAEWHQSGVFSTMGTTETDVRTLQRMVARLQSENLLLTEQLRCLIEYGRGER